jgi:hypothetical protein
MPVKRPVTAASCRNRRAASFATAAPVSLERLHLCCKGSCEFVESSLRTVLLKILTDRESFDSAKTENRSTATF